MEIVQRQWGKYYVLDSSDDYKVKRLVVNPKKKLSMQRHFKRAELWQVVSGEGILYLSTKCLNLLERDSYFIQQGVWHTVENISDTESLVIIEIQTGICEEEDIERKV